MVTTERRMITFALLFYAFVPQLHSEPLGPIPLWADGAPGALGVSDRDIPTITVYLPAPEKANGTAVLICPGGGYGWLAESKEGTSYALWLNENGVAGIVLKYRIAQAYRYPSMFDDVSRAIRLVRSKVLDWKIDPGRVGIMGSSAGGHLAALLLTHFDLGKANDSDGVERFSSRPDFGVLCYPGITLEVNEKSGTGEAPSRKNLLGDSASADLVEQLSCENHVTNQTPPCFIWSLCEDKRVNPTQNALAFASALGNSQVPFELHIYEKGNHGMGLGGTPPGPYHRWTDECLAWLRSRGLVR